MKGRECRARDASARAAKQRADAEHEIGSCNGRKALQQPHRDHGLVLRKDLLKDASENDVQRRNRNCGVGEGNITYPAVLLTAEEAPAHGEVPSAVAAGVIKAHDSRLPGGVQQPQHEACDQDYPKPFQIACLSFHRLRFLL